MTPRPARLVLPLLAAWLAAGPIQPGAAQAPHSPVPPIAPAPWPLTDALGRKAPIAGEAPAPRPDRYVGIFYFLWHNNRGGASPDGGPFDIQKILLKDPDALQHPRSPLWGPMGMFHYWAEPLYGYYQADDAWVIRRHARLLVDAGIDTLIYDATNVETYPAIYTKIAEVFAAIRAEGGRTPQFCFMVNTEAGKTADRLYKELYEPGRFRDLWFAWDGKPLLICDPAAASPVVRNFFQLRRAHWPFRMVDTRNAWHWEAAHPQPVGYTTDPKTPEQVNVSVAQNLRVADRRVTNMSDGNARGRSFHAGFEDRSPGAVLHGHNAEEQWGRALELDPPFVMVTGWNEWIAGRYGKPDGPIQFVDQYDQEFSRDIEPMKGGHGDNYYAQLVRNVRRYKGVADLPPPSPARTIDLAAGPAAWVDVPAPYIDDAHDTIARDHPGAGGTHHINRTGRHDFVALKAAHDAGHLRFQARLREPVQGSSVPEGTWLLLDADQDPATGWEGYDFIVNRTHAADGSPALERNAGGWNWSAVGPVAARADGVHLAIEVPRDAVGLGNPGPVGVDFRWVDNAQKPGDVLDLYLSGDAAPEGRMRFRYRGQP